MKCSKIYLSRQEKNYFISEFYLTFKKALNSNLYKLFQRKEGKKERKERFKIKKHLMKVDGIKATWNESASHSVMFNSATPWSVAIQALASMGSSRQEYWSASPLTFSRGSSQPRDLSPVSHIAVDSLPSQPPGKL